MALIRTNAASPVGSASDSSSNPSQGRGLYIPDGTDFWLPSCPYDDMVRANTGSFTTNTGRSGHVWTVETGSLQIFNNALVGYSGGTSIGSFNCLGRLDNAYRITAYINTNDTTGSIDQALVIKFLDLSNYIWLHWLGATVYLDKKIGGTNQNIWSIGSNVTGNGFYVVDIDVFGANIIYRQIRSDNVDHTSYCLPTIDTAFILAGATKVGWLTNTTGGDAADRLLSIRVSAG